LKAFEESGESAGDTIEDGVGLFFRCRRGGGAALFFFQEFPVAKHFGGCFRAGVAEDVGMAANHFVVDGADDVVDGEAIFFGGDLRVEEDLKEEVA